MSVVGFDFGTTNSLVSYIQGGKAINYLDDEGLPIPSVVCYEGSKTIVGAEAKQRLGDAGLGIKGNVVRSPKMYLGKESIYIENIERNPVDIVADVVDFVAKKMASTARGNIVLERAVVTIPVDMKGYQRAALRDAFMQAGISIVQFVHEPLAALYGYFRSQTDLAAMLRNYDRKLILVFDWGGGTLDLTLCRLMDGMLVQIKNDGTDEVGGDAFDDIMKNELIRRALKQRGLDESTQIAIDAKTRLLHRCERAKIDLSTRDQVGLYVADFFKGQADVDFDYSLSRDELESIISPLLDKGLNRINTLLESANIAPAQISMCLATGGMANMPAIKARLHEWFGAQRVHISDKSGTLIAEGAAWIAHDRAQLQLAKRFELLMARNSYITLVESGVTMPTEGEVQGDQFHLYCVDPRDGHAKFQLCAPVRPGKKILPNDKRLPLAVMVLAVDGAARPFHERLELDIKIDDNLILHATATSLNKKDLVEEEVHDLEFALSLAEASDADNILDEEDDIATNKEDHEPGSLALRSNIVDRKHDFFVPGELLYTYNPAYFDPESNLPKIQDMEKLYYQPCAICKRAANDPLCRCASELWNTSSSQLNNQTGHQQP